MISDSPRIRVKVWFLGPFALEVNAKEVPVSQWKSKKALNLFRYLASRRGEKVPKDVLNELLWPDTDLDASTEQNLHTCVYFVRRIIDPDLKRYAKSNLLTCSGGLYCLERTDECWVDTEEFEELYTEGRKLEKIDPAAAIASFRGSLELYRGDFLVEEPYLDWTIELREYYREMFIDGTLRLAELLASYADDLGEAIRICRQGLRKDPYREDLYHALIGYLIDAGRYTEAATQYTAYAKMMHDEFGLDPSREARALLERIHSGGRIDAHELAKSVPTRSGGAYVGDRAFFEAVCHLEARRRDRSQEPVTLMMISVYGSKSMEKSADVAASVLRKGDVVCQWDQDKLGICLWGTDETGAKVVGRRVKRELEKTSGVRVGITYEVLKSGSERPILGALERAF